MHLIEHVMQCPDCEWVAAENEAGYGVLAVRLCLLHAAMAEAETAAARAANSEVDAVHRMMEYQQQQTN